MDDFRTVDKAFDGFRHSNVKVIVFVCSGRVKRGIQSNEIRLPYSGKIIECYGSVAQSGTAPIVADIELCTQAGIDSTPSWNSVLIQPLQIDANERSSRTSSAPYALADLPISVGDHFRINILNTSEEIRDLTVEVTIKLY
jgi:hypothetical protein